MAKKKKHKVRLILAVVIVATTIFFGRVETRHFSAYAACRRTAMATKGYAVWKHTGTVQWLFITQVKFSDGFNDLVCTAFGVGPFWVSGFTFQTLVGCTQSLGSETICPEDYFGVSP